MPNYNYIKGVKKERAIVNDARKNGLIAFRSAGSHSPIDVCIIDEQNKKIWFVQCKPDDMNATKKQKLRDEHKELNNYYDVSFTVK